MITINLLPVELRRAGTPSRSLLYVVGAGIILIMLAGFAYAYLHFKVSALDSRVREKARTVASLEERAAEVDALEEDMRDYKERERAIIEIKTKRILWSRKLDEFARLTPASIWLTRMEMRKYSQDEYTWEKGKVQTGGFLEIRCYASGRGVTNVTRFRRALTGVTAYWRDFLDPGVSPSDFFSDFMDISKPAWEAVKLAGFREESNVKSRIRLELKPLYAPPGESGGAAAARA